MRKINYKSDFDVIVRMRDLSGTWNFWPDCDWTMRFYTGDDRINQFVASRVGDTYTNCFLDNKQVHVVFNRHRLGVGVLKMELHLKYPNGIYPDGIRDTYTPEPLNIELVDDRGNEERAIETEVVVPVLTEYGPALPFTFSEKIPDVVRYDRDRKFFLKNGEAIPPGDYNEWVDSEGLRASRSKLFISSNQIYRFTGRDFVNVAIERNPNQRICNHVPNLNAHPGLLYLNRGYISLGHKTWPKQDAPRIRVSLKGLYLQNDIKDRIPLSSLTLITSVNLESEIEGDTLIVKCRNESHLNNWVWLHLPDEPCFKTPYIGVKVTAAGEKVFYPVSTSTIVRPRPAPPTVEEFENLTNYVDSRGPDLRDHHPRVRLQIWKQNLIAVGRRRDENGKRKLRRQWRWRSKGLHHIGTSCLVRASIKRGHTWSDWAYFHIKRDVSRYREFKVVVSRRRKELKWT